MELKVLVLNLWNGGELFEAALSFIKQADADVVMLQEVYDGREPTLPKKFRSLSILRKQLGYLAHDYAPEFIDNRQEGRIPQGNAIFSKFPIIESQTIFFDRPLDENYVGLPENFPTISRNLQGVLLDTSAGKVHVFNFHGVWDLNGEDFTEARKNMSKVIVKSVTGKQKVILAGDTNVKPTNPAILNIEKQLKSVFGNTLPTTFNMRRKDNPGYASAAVDMIFVSNDIKVVAKDCPDLDVSDHLPLIATLQLVGG